ncbi:helix-turn-helix transcriptional regulator [Affinibrenneria salicis]|uniref:Helix-turn-helix transcriptional regulator n=1 Tax=Affinibrenneria salicis TaxID=2590031 RepID=A0A5J5FVN5_9GAMM|nr:helix-turn-helix transcriptional regulator [Affinibrenneria salicis]KAA8997408.1 helix-turn-helix transcriptional regulator [Affinibrenneria salicis]
MGNKYFLSLENLAWHREFGRLIDSLDMPEFWYYVARYLRERVVFNNWAVLLFSRHNRPVILAESDDSDGSDAQLFIDYQKGLYLLDPFYINAWRNPGLGLQRLVEVAPAHFRETEYYRRYFKRNIVEDEVQFNLPLDEQNILCLSLGASTAFSSQDIGVMTLTEPWLLPLMRQRMRFELSAGDKSAAPLCGQSAQFATLTERENEVMHLMLSGCSTKEISRRLAISIETVRAHKKHLYAKLKVKTQSALFALFWQRRQE